MSAQTADSQFHFKLPSLSYIDAKWEEPSLLAPTDAGRSIRTSGTKGWFARSVDSFRTWRRNSQAASELATMSDYELMDIGISRSDLQRVFQPEFSQDLGQRNRVA